MSSEEDIDADNSPELPGNSKDNAFFDPKPKPKVIRVLTVLAYILSVSMAAILLSIYYIFMWHEEPSDTKKYAPNNTNNVISRSTLPFRFTEDEDNITAKSINLLHLDNVVTGELTKDMQDESEGNALFPESTTTAEEITNWSDLNTISDTHRKTSNFLEKLMSTYAGYD